MTQTLFGQQFALKEPRLLWVAAICAVLTVALWLWRGWGRAPLWAVALRLLALLAFALALAQPSMARPAPSEATVFVVDRSRSMGGERLRQVGTQVNEAIAANAGREPLGLVAFAETAEVVYPLGAVPAEPDAVNAALESAQVGSGDYSDLTAALRLAEALPLGGAKRLVVFSDGRETLGRAYDWAAGARSRGVIVEAVTPQGRPWGGDVRLAELAVPESTWQGADIEIGAVVNSDQAGAATVRLFVDGRPAGQQVVTLTAGTNNYRFALTPLPQGYHALRAEVVSGLPGFGDAVADNNALGATTVVREKPRVLILEGQPGNGDRLARALRATSHDVTVREPGTLTDRLSALSGYDAVVLVDVSADVLSYDRQKLLQEYARSLGRGLVVIGGNNSFGKGNYEQSVLEETLQVRVKPRDEAERQPAALLIILDRSYSMDFPRNGPTRMEMAKAAAAGAVRALSPGDEIAILTYSSDNQWVTRLRTINSPDDINSVVDQISRVTPDGDTQMYPALREGIDELSKSRLGTRHIIFLSDGEPSRSFDVDELTGRVRAGGLTLSSIAIGEGAATGLMERLAKGGNGRYHFARRPEEIPRLTLEETEQLAGRTIATGNFRAVQTEPSPIMRGLDPAKVPTFDGYQITEAKPDAQVVLTSAKGEPVLAQWQYGLGRVVVWTSDTGQELARQWRDDPAFGQVWNQAVRWTLAESSSRYFRLRAGEDGRDWLVTLDAFDEEGTPVNLAETRGLLSTRDGTALPVALPQTGPGRYELRLARPAPGSYRLEVRQTRSGRTVTDVLGFRVPYPAELRAPTIEPRARAQPSAGR